MTSQLNIGDNDNWSHVIRKSVECIEVNQPVHLIHILIIHRKNSTVCLSVPYRNPETCFLVTRLFCDLQNEPRREKTDFLHMRKQRCKDADQLRDNRKADQRLCFRYIDSAIPLLPKYEIILCGCTAWFVSDLVGNPEDRFSRDEARIIINFGTFQCSLIINPYFNIPNKSLL